MASVVAPVGAVYVPSLAELMRVSDFVSVTLPYNASTERLEAVAKVISQFLAGVQGALPPARVPGVSPWSKTLWGRVGGKDLACLLLMK